MAINFPSACVLDSFAVLAYLKDEPGADLVSDLLDRGDHRATELFMHAVNLGEVYYVVYRGAGDIQAEAVYARVKGYPISFVAHLEEDLLLTAARLKGQYRLSYADAFAAATAILRGVPLVTGDPEFRALAQDHLLKLLWH